MNQDHHDQGNSDADADAYEDEEKRNKNNEDSGSLDIEYLNVGNLNDTIEIVENGNSNVNGKEKEKEMENENEEENLSEIDKLMMAVVGAKLNFECACTVEKIIATVGDHEDTYKWLLERLMKALDPNFNTSGKISQLREWLNFSNPRSNDDLEILKFFLETATMIESKRKA